MGAMPQKSRLNLPPPEIGAQNLGKHLAALRKRIGLTQVQLAEKVGIVQALVSSYESNRLRIHSDMILRFAHALGVSVDELLGVESQGCLNPSPSLAIIRRLQEIEELPPSRKKTVLSSLDMMIRAAKE